MSLSRTTPLLRAQSRRAVALFALLFVSAACASVCAQTVRVERGRKLPAPDRIVSDYVKAVGGKQKLRTLQDATYEWLVQVPEQTQGHARTVRKAPDAVRTDVFLNDTETNAAVNARTAWRRDADGSLRTLTGGDARASKLQGALEASRLLDLKKRDVLARTLGFESAPDAGAAVYVVEFSRRDGARVRCRFGVESKLLVQVADEAHQTIVNYHDYRAEAGALEPHRVEIIAHGAAPLVFTLQSVRYNTGVADALFEPPGDSSLNVVALLREVAHHQQEIEQRVSDYTFTRREIEREFDDKGTVKKEKTTVHEVYPLPGGRRVLKLISEDGAMLTPERAAREEKRVTEEIEQATREYEQRKAKRERERAQKQAGDNKAANDDEELGGLGAFVRVCEFVAPRRERFQDRDVIVFDFRARPGFKPRTRTESAVAKLIGVAWIDPADKQIMRLDARFPEGFKIGGGLVASLRPGSAFMFEQTRLADGVWLPHLSQINMAVKVFLVAGINRNTTREYSNYKRFTTNVGDATVATPTPTPASTMKD